MIKILLTGGNGMVGQNILENVDAKKYSIMAPSSKELNLLDYSTVNLFIKKHQPDFIIHAAGLVGGIQANIKNPVNFLVKNTDIARNILLAAKENNIKNLLNLGSSCMYPKNAKNPLKEEFVLKGELEPTNEGYAIAKIYSARLCEYIGKENKNFQYKTAIPCNLYGKYDKFSLENSHLIPAVIKKIIDAKKNQTKVIIWGDGKARREFMYAEDLANFIFYAIDNFKNMPQNLNVGLGTDYTINEYYKTIAAEIKFTGQFEHDLTKPVGMKQKLVDITKLTGFGWKSKTSLEQGIKKTIEFYNNNLNLWNTL